MNITDALKRFRQENNLTQKDVAQVLGITPQAYYRFEKVESAASAEVIVKIAKAYDVSSDYLLGLTDECRSILAVAEETEVDDAASNELTIAAENDRILDYHQTLAHVLAKQGIKI